MLSSWGSASGSSSTARSPTGGGASRRLLAGIGLYVGASVLCALSTGVASLIALRLLQGLGACAGPLIARAVVRDVYDRDLRERGGTVWRTTRGLHPSRFLARPGSARYLSAVEKLLLFGFLTWVTGNPLLALLLMLLLSGAGYGYLSGGLFRIHRTFDRWMTIRQLERTVHTNPYDAAARADLGRLLVEAGRPATALPETAREKRPICSTWRRPRRGRRRLPKPCTTSERRDSAWVTSRAAAR